MKLSLEQIKAITLGAVRIEETEQGIKFFRFTENQEELYKKRSDDYYLQSFSPSGIKFSFCTDSETLGLKTTVSKGSSRSYFAFDLFVDGKRVDCLKNFDETALPSPYTTGAFEFGEFSKIFELGFGKKQIELYFPWSVQAVIREISVDDGAFLEPIKPKHKLLCFGDSITHGYDALYPSNKYITKIAYFLEAEEINKAIGGEVFFPDLAAAKEDFTPDYITVAYGTNDWNRNGAEETEQNCKGFLENLAKNYPTSKIFVITPIWRKDLNEPRKFGKFEEVSKMIEKNAKPYKNITVINGFDFVEQDESFFADLRLHPNDKGFESYFKALSKKIKI